MNASWTRNGIGSIGFVALAAMTGGWGPHSDITRAATQRLDRDNPLVRFLGDDIKRVANNGWLPDREGEWDTDANGRFWVNNYLYFSGAPDNRWHTTPGIYANYAPFFRRALKYLRTESSAKAARQVAAICHWVQDTGAPPHAYRGETDSQHYWMEHCLDGDDISTGSYSPRLLGTTESAAITELLRRGRLLEDYAHARAVKMMAYYRAGNRSAARPLALQCANECARLTADALHTLGVLLGRSRPGTSALAWPVSGRVTTTFYYASGTRHGGVDIAENRDAVVGAARRGKVTIASTGWNDGRGTYVRIYHENGYTTDYQHLGRLSCSKYQKVECMTKVGVVGETGKPTSPQLHFELRRYGTKVVIPATRGQWVGKGKAVAGSWPSF